MYSSISNSIKPQMSRLFQLPVELVEIITSFLPPEDLFNLRLTCHELSTKTFHYFTQEHFTIKQFFPSVYGLEALLAISKSRLRESLRTVVLGPTIWMQHILQERPRMKEIISKLCKVIFAMLIIIIIHCLTSDSDPYWAHADYSLCTCGEKTLFEKTPWSISPPFGTHLQGAWEAPASHLWCSYYLTFWPLWEPLLP